MRNVYTAIKTILAATVLLLSVGWAQADDGAGKVCIRKIPSGPKSDWKANATGATEQSIFSVRIDKLPAIKISAKDSGVFTNLATAKRHEVRIWLEDKSFASFKFTFEKGENHLMLWYNEFYGTWSLSKVKVGDACACPKSKVPAKGAKASS